MYMNTLDNLGDSKSKNFKSHFTEVTSFSKIAAASAFIILPFVGFYLGTKYSNVTVPVYNPSEYQVNEVESQIPHYKKTFMGGQIPKSWSTYHTSDISVIDTWPPEGSLHKNVVFSAATNDVVFYDLNADQIDFYWLSNKGGKEFIAFVEEESKKYPEISSEKKIINGAQAFVVTWPLDNGEVTKAGTGGKSVLISTGDTDDSQYILVEKQALGDQVFEDVFSHYLDSIDIGSFNDPMKFYGSFN